MRHRHWAGTRNRTEISNLEGWSNSLYTIPASFTSWWDEFLRVFYLFERIEGIEPSSSGWKPDIISLSLFHYTTSASLSARWDLNPRLKLSQDTATGIVFIRHHCYSPIKQKTQSFLNWLGYIFQMKTYLVHLHNTAIDWRSSAAPYNRYVCNCVHFSSYFIMLYIKSFKSLFDYFDFIIQIYAEVLKKQKSFKNYDHVFHTFLSTF